MAKYFIYPFGVNGDLTAIPNPTDPNGYVSYQTGWTYDYERAAGDSLAKNIPRPQSNQLYYDITNAIKQYQEHGTPDFIQTTDNNGVAFPYDIFARVRYDAGDGNGPFVYTSLITANTNLPTVASAWRKGDAAITALTGDVTASGTGSVAATIAPNAVTTGKIAAQAVTLNKIQQIPSYSIVVNDQSTAQTPDTVQLTNKQLLGFGDTTAGHFGAIGIDSTLSILGNTLGVVPQQNSLTTNGYQKILGGLILQWGTLPNIPMDESYHTITYPIAFPNACLNVQMTLSYDTAVNGAVAPDVKRGTITNTNFIMQADQTSNVLYGDVLWFAIGF